MASNHLRNNPGNVAFRDTPPNWTKRLQLAALIFATTLVSGCASIFGLESETLPITSQPSDAQILITDEAGYTVYRGRTPDKVALPKSDGRYFGGKTFSIAISKKGYVTQRVTIDAQPNALYLGGNILAGGLIGWLVIDPTSGKMYELSKAGVDVTLKKRPEPAADVAATAVTPSGTLPTGNAVPPAVTDSPVTDMRPHTAAPTAAVAAPVVSSPPASAVAAPPSIFVPERPAPTAPPPEPAVKKTADVVPRAEPEPQVPLSTTEPPGPTEPPPAESNPPPPYWPAPPKLPVSPSTRAPGSLLLAAA